VDLEQNLKKFISMKSVLGDREGNDNAVKFVVGFLRSLGFSVRVRGGTVTDQPTIIAHLKSIANANKIVLYGHYDVAPIDTDVSWVSSDPFVIEKIDQRVYGRGVADNKGPLMARLQAIKELVEKKKPLPEILWLIQGEEEIVSGKRVATDLFKDELSRFNAHFFVEETGFNDLDMGQQIAFLWSPKIRESKLSEWRLFLTKSLVSPDIQYRHLNKLNGIDSCPFLGNLPDNAIYIGFGPNDRLHNIHGRNESLDVCNLYTHKNQFESFLTSFNRWPRGE